MNALDLQPVGVPEELLPDTGLPVLADRMSYPVEALGPLLGEAAATVAQTIQAPLEIAAQSVLAVASFAAQDKANIEMDGRRYPLSLFLITVAESGDRKSACDRVVSLALDEWQRQQATVYRRELKEYRAAKMADDLAARNILANCKSPCEAEAALKQLESPEPPREPIIIAQEPTLEGLQRSFRLGRPSQALFNDEGAQFFGGHAMSTENRLKTIAGLSKYWDGAPIIRTRAAEGESAAMYDRRLAIHLQVQPRVAEDVLTDRLLMDQGLLARFLIAEARSLAGTRLYKHLNPHKHPALMRFHARITQLLWQEPEIGDDGGLRLGSLRLSKGACDVWVSNYDSTEREQGPGGTLEQIKPAASKAAENALRLAGVMAIIEGDSEVTADQMERAWLLSTYYLQRALRAAQSMESDRLQLDALAVLEWLQGRSGGAGTIVEAQKLLTPKRLRKSASGIRALLLLLERAGKVRVTSTNQRGAPCSWEVAP